MRVTRIRIGLALALLLAACRGPQRPYAVIGTSAEPLRAEFNRAAGHPRIVILAAPT